jgi:competence protein ComEA
MRGPQLLTLGLALELNQATREDLEALPGIGPVLAGRIMEYRRTHGPFASLADLEQVSGIGPKKLEQIKPYLFLGEPVTGDPSP